MEAKLEKIENSEAYIGIEVDAEKFEEGLDKAYRKVVKQVSVPGFRKGRVPRPLLEAHYGKEVLYQDALEVIVPDAYKEALEKLNIEALAQPSFDIEEIKEGEPFKFQARVAVKPEFELGKLEGYEVSIPRFEITEEDVENKLQDMRSQYAQLVEKIDEPAELGDKAYIDYEGFIDGEAFAGGQGNDYPLELGSNSFIPGFEDQLIGLKIGEEKDIQVTFQEEYHAKELAGKDAVFKVKINKIETKKLRELNDDFAQEVSEFETIAELRDDIRKRLENIAEARKKETIKQQVIEQALQNCDIPLAESLLEQQLQYKLEQFKQMLAGQGLSLEQYYQFSGTSTEKLKEELRPEAEKSLKTNFLLGKIVEEKGISVTEEEVNKQIEDMAKEMKMEPEKARATLGELKDNIYMSLKIDKAVNYLVENAIITEKKEINPAGLNEVENGEYLE
ncbi:MAG: trigger factor [Syntrophomonadaceae bacterium]